MSHQLVTHARPHIDDIAALWLLKRFHPEFQSATVEFLERPLDTKFVIHEDATAIGIGGGQFDEHRPDGVGECATTLVWQWLVREPGFQVSAVTRRALELIVAWVKKEDLGELKNESWFEWTVTIPVEQLWNVAHGDPQQVFDFGALTFDALLVYFCSVAALDLDWPKRIDFNSRWGKAIAIESGAGGVSQRAYSIGASLVVQIDPTSGARSFRTHGRSTGIDLTDIYTAVHAKEPEASWYLHPAKTMLLCGSRSAPNFTASQLTLEEMIDLVRAK